MSGGGGSSSDGSNDMQVSGAEAAYSNEKGISTHADTRTSSTSYSGANNDGSDRAWVQFRGRVLLHHDNTKCQRESVRIQKLRYHYVI